MKDFISGLIKLNLFMLLFLVSCQVPFKTETPTGSKSDSTLPEVEKEEPAPPTYEGVEAPLSVEASDGEYLDKIVISWEASKNATHYQLYRSIDRYSEFVKIIDNVTELSYEDIIRPENQGVIYFYMVKAVASDGLESGFSVASSGYATGLNPPLNIRASQMEYADKIALSWTPSVGATGYLIKRSNSAGGSFEELPNVASGNFFLDEGLEFDNTYYYVIYALLDSDISQASAVVSGRTLSSASPAAPVITNYEITNNQIRIEWENSSGLASEVERSESLAFGYENLTTNFSTSVGFTDSSSRIMDGRELYYRVRFFTEIDGSRYYSPFGYVLDGEGNPMPLSIPVLVPEGFASSSVDKEDAVSLTWIRESNTSNYYVERSEDGEDWSVITVDGTESSYEDSDILPGIVYSYRLQRETPAGKKSPYTEIVTTATMVKPSHFTKVSFLPTNFDSDNGLKLSWTAIDATNLGEISYNIYRDGELVGNSSEDFYYDETALYGVQYNYQITAHSDFAGESPLSVEIPCVRDMSNLAMYSNFVNTFRSATIALNAADSSTDKTINITEPITGSASFTTGGTSYWFVFKKTFSFLNYSNGLLILDNQIIRDQAGSPKTHHKGVYNGSITLTSLNSNYSGSVEFHDMYIDYTPKDSGSIKVFQTVNGQIYETTFNANDNLIKDLAFFQ
ncbi:MAG: hypothetical protein JXR63_01630 [Spirochaetales bacterium]|nr:hypothetical protein [Spirochaetales bacterium]